MNIPRRKSNHLICIKINQNTSCYLNQGNDILQGDAGNDLIQGDAGNDQIFGGNGNDILTGGPGKDHFNCGAGTDTITDFQSGVDTKTANCE